MRCQSLRLTPTTRNEWDEERTANWLGLLLGSVDHGRVSDIQPVV